MKLKVTAMFEKWKWLQQSLENMPLSSWASITACCPYHILGHDSV